MGYKIIRFLINLIIRLFTRVEVHGLENVPPAGGYIIAANHLGRLDPALVYCYTNRSDVILMVAEKYHKIVVFRWVVNWLDGIWVDRFNADFGALRKALTRLKNGAVLVLAPEGTRSPTEALLEARPGTGYLAAKAGVPIVPAALTGSEDRKVVHELLHLRRPHIQILIGSPFRLSPASSTDRDTLMSQYTDEIMCRIAALLPPSYRGVYADHPRLQELLANPS